MTTRELYSSTVRTRYELVGEFMQNQVHEGWYAMLYGALRDEIDHNDCYYEREQLEVLERAAEILKAKKYENA